MLCMGIMLLSCSIYYFRNDITHSSWIVEYYRSWLIFLHFRETLRSHKFFPRIVPDWDSAIRLTLVGPPSLTPNRLKSSLLSPSIPTAFMPPPTAPLPQQPLSLSALPSSSSAYWSSSLLTDTHLKGQIAPCHNLLGGFKFCMGFIHLNSSLSFWK